MERERRKEKRIGGKGDGAERGVREPLIRGVRRGGGEGARGR